MAKNNLEIAQGNLKDAILETKKIYKALPDREAKRSFLKEFEENIVNKYFSEMPNIQKQLLKEIKPETVPTKIMASL